MTGNAYVQPNGVEQFNPSELQQLAQEVGSLRVIVAELLIQNQNLRWELQAHDPKLSIASEGTPFRKYSRTVAMP